jgi:arylsulfatase A-like enzyme
VQRYAETVDDFYRLADWSIGRAIEGIDEDTIILVLSDHGFQSAASAGSRLAIDVNASLDRIGLRDRIRAFKVNRRLYLRTVEDAESGTDGTTARARSAFESAEHTPSGLPLFRIEDQGDGSFILELNPELDLRSEDPVRIGGAAVSLSQLTQESLSGGGMHEETGIFLMVCPRCKADARIPELRVQDVTPTLLYTLDLPVGSDMDGTARTDVLRPAAEPARRVRFIDTYDHGLRFSDEREVDDPEMVDLLRAVGYVE